MLVCYNLTSHQFSKMFAAETNYLRARYVNVYSGKINQKVTKKNVCISPRLIRSPFNIPDSPEYLSAERINTMTNIYILKKFEYEYDDFLEKKFQILMLLNNIDEVFEIRDTLILRINALRRQQMIRQISYERRIG